MHSQMVEFNAVPEELAGQEEHVSVYQVYPAVKAVPAFPGGQTHSVTEIGLETIPFGHTMQLFIEFLIWR